MLPKEELYMPPLNIRVRDHRAFGRKPVVGVHVLKNMLGFRCAPPTHMAIPQEALAPGTLRTAGLGLALSA